MAKAKLIRSKLLGGSGKRRCAIGKYFLVETRYFRKFE